MKEFEKEIRERFYLCYSFEQFKLLTENGFRYLFVCNHKQSGKRYFVFDKTPELIEVLEKYRESKKSKPEME